MLGRRDSLLLHAPRSYELCYEPHNEAHNGPTAAISLLIVVLTSGARIMRYDVSPGGSNSALLAFHYEHFPHNEANTLTSARAREGRSGPVSAPTVRRESLESPGLCSLRWAGACSSAVHL